MSPADIVTRTPYSRVRTATDTLTRSESVAHVLAQTALYPSATLYPSASLYPARVPVTVPTRAVADSVHVSDVATAGVVGGSQNLVRTATDGVHYVDAATRTLLTGRIPTNPASSLSMTSPSGVGNITVTFDKTYQVGVFPSGEYFVLPDPSLGTVIVSAMTPTYTTGRHGYAVNPQPVVWNVENSFDSRGPEDSAFIEPPALPLSLTANQSLVKVASMATQTSYSWIDNAEVITCLAISPPAGTMRPAAFGTDKRLISSTPIAGALFPNLAAAAVPNRLTYAQCLARCDQFRCDWHPGPSWGYYRSSAAAVPGGLTWGGDVLKSDIELLCSLCLDHLTATQKKDVAMRYAQHGIDTWGCAVPSTGGGAGFLRGGGANGAGHLLSTVFAAWVTGDASIGSFLDNASEATWNPSGGEASIGAAELLFWETASFHRSPITQISLWGKRWETWIGDGERQYWSDLNVPTGTGVNNATLRDPYERIDGGPVPGGSYQSTVSHQIMGLAALLDVMVGFQTSWPTFMANDSVMQAYGHRWQTNGIRTSPDPVAPKTASGVYGVNYGPTTLTGAGPAGYDGDGVNGYRAGAGRAISLNDTGASGGNRFSQLTDDFCSTYSAVAAPPVTGATPLWNGDTYTINTAGTKAQGGEGTLPPYQWSSCWMEGIGFISHTDHDPTLHGCAMVPDPNPNLNRQVIKVSTNNSINNSAVFSNSYTRSEIRGPRLFDLGMTRWLIAEIYFPGSTPILQPGFWWTIWSCYGSPYAGASPISIGGNRNATNDGNDITFKTPAGAALWDTPMVENVWHILARKINFETATSGGGFMEIYHSLRNSAGDPTGPLVQQRIGPSQVLRYPMVTLGPSNWDGTELNHSDVKNYHKSPQTGWTGLTSTYFARHRVYDATVPIANIDPWTTGLR